MNFFVLFLTARVLTPAIDFGAHLWIYINNQYADLMHLYPVFHDTDVLQLTDAKNYSNVTYLASGAEAASKQKWIKAVDK